MQYPTIWCIFGRKMFAMPS